MRCPVTKVCPCPILDKAYDRGIEFFEKCSMFKVVKKVEALAKESAIIAWSRTKQNVVDNHPL
jgi:hypothetical protein